MDPFFANFDLAALSIWMFWLFFALLVFYIQRENMREGYPLESDDGKPSANQGPYPLPSPKTFKLPHGRGEVSLPGPDAQRREDLALERTAQAEGFPLEPTGDPMVDGVGPASWAARRDVPELDGHGHNKIVPMGHAEDFFVSAGRDPRGLPVVAGDGETVGEISDMWVDKPEHLVRYLEIELDADHGGGKRLVPIQLAVVKWDRVRVRSIFGKHFANVPVTKSPTQITLLEEEKICAYYGGGKLYASEDRLNPAL
ncbi:MAG: photosynthetic reaction center subunit H [Pseudomonadota bacterium]